MPHTSPHLLVTRADAIKTISFNHPEKKNPLSTDINLALAAELEASRADDTRVVILTGEGGNFGSGAGISPTDSSVQEALADMQGYVERYLNPVALGLRSLPLPVIAKVRGACVGASMSFALACDLIYAAPSARFSQIFTRIGLASDGGGAFFMAHRLGYNKAFELMALGTLLTAEDALELGLINMLCLEEELDDTVAEVATRLAQGPGVALARTKANLNAALDGSLAETLATEAISQGITSRSQDFQEGIMAFLQKRKAEFKGV